MSTRLRFGVQMAALCSAAAVGFILPRAGLGQPGAGPPSTPPSAPPTEEAVGRVELLAADAQRLYAEGRYTEAVQLYLEAFRILPEPALLYNVAVIYDQRVQEPAIAVDYYRRYITTPGADPAAVSRATERIEALRREMAAPAVASAAPASAAPASAAPAPAAPLAVSEPVAPASDTRWRPIVGWSLVGLAGALGVAGGVLGFMAEADESDFHDSTDRITKRDLKRRGEKRALAADVLFGTGGAALVGGLLVLLGVGEGQADAPAAVGVIPGPDGAAVQLGLTF